MNHTTVEPAQAHESETKTKFSREGRLSASDGYRVEEQVQFVDQPGLDGLEGEI